MNEIVFKEGEAHTVVLTIPGTFPLAGYSASIQVRHRPTSNIDFEFRTDDSTLIISEQTVILNIPANITISKADHYKWQLRLFTNDVNARVLDIFDFIIQPSITI